MPISARDRYEAAQSAMKTEAVQNEQIRAVFTQIQQDMEAQAAEQKGKGGSWKKALGGIGEKKKPVMEEGATAEGTAEGTAAAPAAAPAA